MVVVVVVVVLYTCCITGKMSVFGMRQLGDALLVVYFSAVVFRGFDLLTRYLFCLSSLSLSLPSM